MAFPKWNKNEEIDRKIALLHREIYNCEHCALLRAEIVNLMNIRLPDPIEIKRDLIREIMQKFPQEKI